MVWILKFTNTVSPSPPPISHFGGRQKKFSALVRRLRPPKPRSKSSPMLDTEPTGPPDKCQAARRPSLPLQFLQLEYWTVHYRGQCAMIHYQFRDLMFHFVLLMLIKFFDIVLLLLLLLLVVVVVVVSYKKHIMNKRRTNCIEKLCSAYKL